MIGWWGRKSHGEEGRGGEAISLSLLIPKIPLPFPLPLIWFSSLPTWARLLEIQFVNNIGSKYLYLQVFK